MYAITDVTPCVSKPNKHTPRACCWSSAVCVCGRYSHAGSEASYQDVPLLHPRCPVPMWCVVWAAPLHTNGHQTEDGVSEVLLLACLHSRSRQCGVHPGYVGRNGMAHNDTGKLWRRRSRATTAGQFAVMWPRSCQLQSACCHSFHWSCGGIRHSAIHLSFAKAS